MASSGVKLKTLPAILVTAAGTRKQIYPNHLLVYSVTIQSLRTNTGTQYFGDGSVLVGSGTEMLPGDLVEVEPPSRARATDQFDISDIYVTSDVAAEFRIVAWIRE
jgi:multidrug efflux pump subunit AcrA (membrane-fusion protein)